MHLKYLFPISLMICLCCSCGNKQNDNQQQDTSREKSDQSSRQQEKTDAEIKNDIELSENLKSQGLKLGKVKIKSSDTAASDHVLRAYLIFKQDFKDTLRVTVTDKDKLEYGRLHKAIKRRAGDADFVDFIFTSKTDIESKSHILIDRF